MIRLILFYSFYFFSYHKQQQENCTKRTQNERNFINETNDSLSVCEMQTKCSKDD